MAVSIRSHAPKDTGGLPFRFEAAIFASFNDDLIIMREKSRKSSNPRLQLTYGLIIESHQLTAAVPEKLRHEVGRVHSGSFGIDPTQLGFIVSG